MSSLPPNEYVFISYSHKDAAIQQRILASLRDYGIPVWIDKENLQPGTRNWERSIEDAIKGCGAIAVLLSPTASKSDWVLREVQFADIHLKRIIPVLIVGTEASSLPIHLVSYQRVDLTKEWNLGMRDLGDTLKRYSLIETQKMKVEAELAAQEAAKRQSVIKAAQEKAAQENAEKSVREEARRVAAEKAAREEAARMAAEAARRKAVEDAARKDWVTSDDKLWAALGYAIPIVAIVVLFMEDKKSRPFIEFNAVQSLVATVILLIFSAVTLGLGSILFLVSFWWAYQAYQGQEVNIPLISDFIRNQGWG